MIPQKQKTTSLDEQLEKDIKAAEDKSKEDIKKSKPKLAQAAVMKYSKYGTIVVFSIVIGYKMFFSGTSTEKKVVKKKQVSKSISQTDVEQKKLQQSSAGSVSSKPSSLTEENKNQIKAISSKMYSNTETLSSVSVPKLTIPETPNVPEIKTITIEKEITNKEKQLELTKQLEEQRKEIEELKALQKKQQQENNKNDINIRTAKNNIPTNNIVKSPISQSNQKNLGTNFHNKQVARGNNNLNTTDGSLIEKMFLLSGNTTQNTSSTYSSSKDDFIIVDTSTISEKQPITNSSIGSTQKLTNLEYTIATGRVIEGVLETAINSEIAGTVRAVVSKDVYGESGDNILIPMGSRLYGSYATTQTATQRRLLLTWNKIIRPDGIVVSVSADTYDQTGRKGIEGEIDTRYGEVFRNSLLYSFIALGTAVAIEKLAGVKGTSITSNGAVSSTTISPAATAAQSVVESVQDIADKMTDGLTDDLNSIVSIPQGQLLKIMPTSDIVITVPYKRRTQNVHLD